MRRDRVIRSHIRTRFVVTLKSGEAFDGLLLDADATTAVLGDASLLTPTGRTHVDGQLMLARTDIAYMQLPTVTAEVISQ